MRLEPLKQWICDDCGKLISRPEDGWVEWKLNLVGKRENFRIVHHHSASPRKPNGNCYQKIGNTQDHHLKNFLGADGLFAFIPLVATVITSDLDRFWEVFCRLQIPHFEEACYYWKLPEITYEYEELSDNGLLHMFAQENLVNFIERIRSQEQH